jgi:hypothetical protein
VVFASNGFTGYAFCIPDDSAGLAFCVPDGFSGCVSCILKWFLPLHRALFFRTGLQSPLRTSNPSNPVEATGFAGKKGMPLAARTIVGLTLHA